jgi:hypothetical protein
MAVAASCLLFAACDDDDDDGTNPPNQSTIRFANAMTGGTGTLALTAGSNAQGGAVNYQTASSCQNLTTGNTSFSISTPGSGTPLVSIPAQNLTAGSRHTIIALGSATAPTALFLTDNFTTPATGRAQLRIINATTVLTPFDVYVTTPGDPLGTANATNVPFNTSQAFLDVPAGLTQVRVTTPGTQTVLGTSADFTLNSGEVRTLVFTPPTTVGGAFTSFFVPQCL